MTLYIITVAFIIAIGAVCIVMASDEDTDNILFLERYGWEVFEERCERVEVEIPEVFDDVYNNYNILQKYAGLDLEKYKGKKAVRYTYAVNNFPTETEDTVYANVLCVNGSPVAGDIMTVRLDGFMYSLNYLKLKK